MPSGIFDGQLDEIRDDVFLEARSVHHLMQGDVVSCGHDATVHDALGRMFDHDVGVLPVVDERGRVVGIVSDRDLARAVFRAGQAPAAIAVSDAMSVPVHTIASTAPLAAAVQALRTHRVRRLPVVDEAGRLVGLLSLDDLARARADGSSRKAAEITDALASIMTEHR